MSAQTTTPTRPTPPNLFHTPPILPSSGAIPDNGHMEAGYEFQRREGAPEAGPGSGDGWVRTGDGRSYWGLFGAAGMLLRHVDEIGVARYLLAQRSTRVHRGHGEWAVPGGAIDSHETPVEAALREFDEEMGPIPSGWIIRGIHRVDPLPGVWSYYTCCADVSERLDYDDTLSWESDAARWFTEPELAEVALFSPFSTVFPKLRAIFEG